eukprot:TRINITY_DN8556_c1_g1_i2.p1 TRINITY_DN8556_c1_g1~~TRINITY_DN8556_c1_g1_i2.p1  ORF type:complete len:645 (-),score=264.68 TRINITY_DN8556_c1_g1_i2:39-1916(-)
MAECLRLNLPDIVVIKHCELKQNWDVFVAAAASKLGATRDSLGDHFIWVEPRLLIGNLDEFVRICQKKYNIGSECLYEVSFKEWDEVIQVNLNAALDKQQKKDEKEQQKVCDEFFELRDEIVLKGNTLSAIIETQMNVLESMVGKNSPIRKMITKLKTLNALIDLNRELLDDMRAKLDARLYDYDDRLQMAEFRAQFYELYKQVPTAHEMISYSLHVRKQMERLGKEAKNLVPSDVPSLDMDAMRQKGHLDLLRNPQKKASFSSPIVMGQFDLKLDGQVDLGEDALASFRSQLTNTSDGSLMSARSGYSSAMDEEQEGEVEGDTQVGESSASSSLVENTTEEVQAPVLFVNITWDEEFERLQRNYLKNVDDMEQILNAFDYMLKQKEAVDAKIDPKFVEGDVKAKQIVPKLKLIKPKRKKRTEYSDDEEEEDDRYGRVWNICDVSEAAAPMHEQIKQFSAQFRKYIRIGETQKAEVAKQIEKWESVEYDEDRHGPKLSEQEEEQEKTELEHAKKSRTDIERKQKEPMVAQSSSSSSSSSVPFSTGLSTLNSPMSAEVMKVDANPQEQPPKLEDKHIKFNPPKPPPVAPGLKMMHNMLENKFKSRLVRDGTLLLWSQHEKRENKKE